MSNTLLEMENGSMQAGVDEVHPRRLDGLVGECFNCALDDAAHDAGREGLASDGGAGGAAPRRRTRSGRSFPSEHMDA